MHENQIPPKFAEYYDLIITSGYFDYKKTVEEVEELLEGRRKILEIGIGTGLLAKPLVEMGYLVTGVDFSRGMLEKAEKRLYGTVTLYEQDIAELNIPDTFEAVISHSGPFFFLHNGDEERLLTYSTDFDAIAESFSRLRNHLQDGSLLLVSRQPLGGDYEQPLGDGLTYSQQVRLVSNHVTKDYFIRKGDKILAEMHGRFGLLTDDELDVVLTTAGFEELRTTDLFRAYETTIPF